jgi:hypothetical protein
MNSWSAPVSCRWYENAVRKRSKFENFCKSKDSFLGCDATESGRYLLKFRRKLPSPSSGIRIPFLTNWMIMISFEYLLNRSIVKVMYLLCDIQYVSIVKKVWNRFRLNLIQEAYSKELYNEFNFYQLKSRLKIISKVQGTWCLLNRQSSWTFRRTRLPEYMASHLKAPPWRPKVQQDESNCVTYSKIMTLQERMRNRDSAIGIVTGNGLDNRNDGVRAPARARVFSSPCRPDRLWSSSSLLYNEYRGHFPQGKTTVAWTYLLIPN